MLSAARGGDGAEHALGGKRYSVLVFCIATEHIETRSIERVSCFMASVHSYAGEKR